MMVFYVNTVRSMQSRISSFLAAGLMIALGVAALSWYYANALSRQKRMRQAATSAAVSSAQGDMTLPPLGKVVAPAAQTLAQVDTRPPAGFGVGARGQESPGPVALVAKDEQTVNFLRRLMNLDLARRPAMLFRRVDDARSLHDQIAIEDGLPPPPQHPDETRGAGA